MIFFKNKYILLFVLTCLVFLLTIVNNNLQSRVQAQSPVSTLDGYAWSSNIGWIFFPVDGVSVDSGGNLSGYAWSSNIGWLQFGGLGGFPSGDSGATASNAKISGGKIVGWAKFVSATGNASGWDGWVLFTGTNHSTNLGGTNFSGYAWGDDVVGWIDFSGVSLIEKIICSSGEILIGSTCTPISCSTSPSNITIQSGYSSENTTVTASPDGAYTYKWFMGTKQELISGANGSSPTISVATSTNANYPSNNEWDVPVIVTISSGAQSATSSECLVHVIDENLVDQCTNIQGDQFTIPSLTQKVGADCTCTNGKTNPPTCTGDNPSTPVFKIVANIAKDTDPRCMYDLTVGSGVTECYTLNRLGTRTETMATTSPDKIQTSGYLPMGAHTLYCTGTNLIEKKYNTEICYSNPVYKEN